MNSGRIARGVKKQSPIKPDYFLTSTMRHPKNFAKNFRQKAWLLTDALL